MSFPVSGCWPKTLGSEQRNLACVKLTLSTSIPLGIETFFR